jgi:hypothetical protein
VKRLLRALARLLIRSEDARFILSDLDEHLVRDLARSSLESVEQVGAARTVVRNLITEDGRGEPVELAEISASAFSLTRVPPLLGRALVPADEQPGAAAVLVIGSVSSPVWCPPCAR